MAHKDIKLVLITKIDGETWRSQPKSLNELLFDRDDQFDCEDEEGGYLRIKDIFPEDEIEWEIVATN